MKTSLLAFFPGIFFCFDVSAQMPVSRPQIQIQLIGTDSVVLSYDHRYFLTKDSCADIVRYAHYDVQQQKFTGRFRDVSKANPGQLMAEGGYNEIGLREGDFVSYYANGVLQAKGRFKDGGFDGRWEIFYPTGDPKINFIASDSEVKVLATWDENGKKLVDNGFGNYESMIGPIVWKGLLVGGQPDGKWVAQRMERSGEELASERFKLGVFQKGKNLSGDYKDASRILLVSAEDLLPFIKAEHFWVSREPCHAAPKKIFISDHYAKGTQPFGEELAVHLTPVLNGLKLVSFNEPIELRGKVLTDGRLVFDATDKTAASLKSGLMGLPLLEPARLDWKKVEQEIVIEISYNMSVYRFRYRFLPLEAR